ncbi:ABC transporter substrate-binding protein [Aestuariibius sp. 2305UL40-4]|uniref:ABC transporter substrate-binding protein n=1 Tax=Aestuariibius violaceus TaxID=3234132 RepID=UPI00345E871E
MGKTRALRLFGYAVAIALTATGSASAETELKLAMKAQPPTLDLHVTSTNTVRNVAAHINEGLFAFDSTFTPHPVLAESVDRSADGLTYTFAIRQGVPFHNGDELAAEDVVASLDRWLRRSSFGRTLAPYVSAVEATDRSTVELRLNAPANFVVTALSTWRAGPFIYPAEVIEAAGDDRITDYIGTGPYRFVDWRDGQEIRLERFDAYAPVDAPADGYTGRRVALADTLRFVFVPELSVRRIGVETGDFDVALDIDPDSYDRYQTNPDVVSSLGAPRMTTLIPNKSGGPMSDPGLRRAVQAAICVEDVLPVYGGAAFWRADPSLTWKETAWWSDAGSDLYNLCDPDLARTLAEAAGYAGEPIRLALSSGDQSKYNVGLVLEQQLERAGLVVELEVRDAAAHEETLDTKSAWDLMISEHTYRSHPILHSHLQATWTGWWENADRDALVAELLTAPEAKAKLIWDRIQRLYYEDAAVIKIGDYFEHHIAGDSVTGYANMPEPFFWNVGVDR